MASKKELKKKIKELESDLWVDRLFASALLECLIDIRDNYSNYFNKTQQRETELTKDIKILLKENKELKKEKNKFKFDDTKKVGIDYEPKNYKPGDVICVNVSDLTDEFRKKHFPNS